MPDAPEPTDEDLVCRVRAGDEAAARLLFDRHLPALRAKARSRLPAALRGKVAESDVIQEAWLAAFLDLGRFEDRGDGSFAAWLRRILERKVLDEVRRHLDAAKRDAQRQVRLATQAERIAAAEGQPSPSAEVMDAEEAARVRAIVASMPEDYAMVMRLVHEEGLSLGDAGVRMGRSADAVRKLYRRALVRLADRMGGPEAQARGATHDPGAAQPRSPRDDGAP
jgi:RNA polymerase sigma-70 factor, ECF subfamily